MAIIECRECHGKVSDTAAACPHCGAPAPSPQDTASEATEKPGGGWWKWVLGIPIGLFVLMMVIGSLQPADPEKDRARLVYSRCIEQLESSDRARLSTANGLATMCEKFRLDFRAKYGVNP